MPVYEYECEECGRITDKIFRIDEKPERVSCQCGASARAIISAPQRRDCWEPYWDEHLGPEPVYVTSREHRRQLKKERGLVDQYHHKPGLPGQWV